MAAPTEHPTVDAELAAFLSSGVAAIVATRDAALRPEITRGWGQDVSSGGDALTLCLGLRPGCRTQSNLADNGAIAVTFSLPTTYRTVQIKGQATVLGEPGPERLVRVREHVAAFVAETAQVGLNPEIAERCLEPELLEVTFSIAEVYDQTPGPAAGSRL